MITVILHTYTITKNNDAFPVVRELTIPPLQRISDFFKFQFGGRDPDNYMIRVNKHPVSDTYELNHKDEIAITPTNLTRTTVLTTSPSSYTTTTTAVSGIANFDPFEDENIDPSLLALEKQVKKLMDKK